MSNNLSEGGIFGGNDNKQTSPSLFGTNNNQFKQTTNQGAFNVFLNGNSNQQNNNTVKAESLDNVNSN